MVDILNASIARQIHRTETSGLDGASVFGLEYTVFSCLYVGICMKIVLIVFR